jgi:tetrahydromethanopterin S-methyltransferase subunit B
LATVIGVVLPFALEGTTSGRLATAIVDLVIGLAIMSLLGSVVARTTHAHGRPGMPY